jgi:hypothetical protein
MELAFQDGEDGRHKRSQFWKVFRLLIMNSKRTSGFKRSQSKRATVDSNDLRGKRPTYLNEST